ncbi:hypothetical protein M0R04_09735 [Candidatus Dojkabacteria bacterium]|jgi:hypothetical protein|nr:hypothetical protein [Candidatus Dojkabacteria bacterium]
MIENNELVKIGKVFEKEVYEFLLDRFDEVEWISQIYWTSKTDFVCKKEGKIYLIDAKLNPTGRYIHKVLDFVVTKINGEIILVDVKLLRKNIKERVDKNAMKKEKLVLLLKEDENGLTIQDIADKTQLTRNTVANVLGYLIGEGKLEIREIGNAKLHYWKKINKKEVKHE